MRVKVTIITEKRVKIWHMAFIIADLYQILDLNPSLSVRLSVCVFVKTINQIQQAGKMKFDIWASYENGRSVSNTGPNQSTRSVSLRLCVCLNAITLKLNKID